MGTEETADQRQAENLGHTIRLEGAQFQTMLLGGQWTPHRSPPEPQHRPGSGPCLSREHGRLQKPSCSSVAQSCPTIATPWTAARQASLSITNSRSLLRLMSIESMVASNHLILCRLLLLLPSMCPSIKVFPNESTLRIRGPKYWSFSFSISPSNEQSGLISFGMDWLKP